MTRMDTVRAATGDTRKRVRHAAEVMAPYAGTARDTAVQYAHEAGARLGPPVSRAARQACASAADGYDKFVVPRLREARKSLPPEVDRAATRAAKRTRKAARKAADYAGPRIESAVAEARSASGPVRQEAVSRGAATVAALRGRVSATEVDRLVRKRERRTARARTARRLGLVGLVAGAVYAGLRCLRHRSGADWLIEPPEATEAMEFDRHPPMSTGNGSDAAQRRAGNGQLNAESEARTKEAEAEAKRRGQ